MRKTGAEFKDAYYYDDTIIFADHSSGDFLNLDLRDSTWSYTIGQDHVPQVDLDLFSIDSDTIRGLLNQWKMTIPENAAFSRDSSGEEYCNYSFTADFIPMDDFVVYGTCSCSFQEADGKVIMTSVDNQMAFLLPYSREDIITPSQALEMLYKGHSFEGDIIEHYNAAQGKVLSCRLDWESDTKGFYQPVYLFELELDGQEILEDRVAALK